MRGQGPSPALAAAFAAALAALAACSVSSDVSRELGARCDELDECDDRCLTGGRYPGGLCSATCEGDGDCPDGATCTDVDGGVCLFECAGADDCGFLGSAWDCRQREARDGAAGEVMVCIGSG